MIEGLHRRGTDTGDTRKDKMECPMMIVGLHRQGTDTGDTREDKMVCPIDDCMLTQTIVVLVVNIAFITMVVSAMCAVLIHITSLTVGVTCWK